jgi:hypothetical protein
MMPHRHNDPIEPHERARTLASDSLDAALAPADASWLDEHLAGCDACRMRSDAYAANRALLRGLPAPEPPRDLWVRTSAALDRERRRRAGAARAGSRRAAGPAAGRGSRVTSPVRGRAMAGIAAILVVGLLVGRAILPQGVAAPAVLLASGAPAVAPDVTIRPAATPLAVPAADVAWVSRATDGTYTVNVASVTSVCPQDAASDCAPFDAAARQVISLDQQPGSVVFAPTLGQAAVVEASAKQSGGSILVVAFTRAAPTPSLPPSPAPTAATFPTESPSAASSTEPSPQPTASTEPTPVTPGPGATPIESPVPPESPVPTAVPTPASAVAIISGIVVVGGDAAYSPDGAWLAFSARSATGTDGPDVYVWHVGDAAARPLTTDHATIFSSWIGGEILASRAVAVLSIGSPSPTPETFIPSVDSPSPSPVTFIPASFALDPTTGVERPLGGSLGWRPVVDPTERWVAYWTGTLRFDPTASTWVPDEGRLVVDAWRPAVDGGTGAVLSPTQSPAPSPTPSPTPSLTPDPQPLLDPKPGEPIRDWTLHWDPTGSFLAVWVGDPLVEGLGRISLIAIDQATGLPIPDAAPLLRDAPALAGFAIGDGRLVWATPSGQDGEGSRLEVLAWQGTDAGKTRTEPAPAQENILVVR